MLGRENGAMTPLCREVMEDSIDAACHPTRDKVEKLRASHGLTIERVVDWSGVLDAEAEEYNRSRTPWHFGIEIRHVQPGENKSGGLLSFYLAYSSWTGRILYVDQVRCHGLEDTVEKLLLQILADIALELECARLTWRVSVAVPIHLPSMLFWMPDSKP